VSEESKKNEDAPAAAGNHEMEATDRAPAEAGDDLINQVTKAREEAKDLEDRMLRLAAEFDNFKKRMQRERETSFKYAEENLLRELLPSLDNLERAVEEGRRSNDAAALLEGVEMTSKGLLATLEKFGLAPLDAKGQPFDPNFHEALAMENNDEVPANVILQEYQKGYQYKDRLLRAAKVVVSQGTKSDES